MQGEGGECWELIHEEGEMKVYKMEIEQEGMVVDPMKAIHTVTVSKYGNMLTCNLLCWIPV